MAHLTKYFDAALEVPSGGSIQLIEEQEQDRLQRLATIAMISASLPRRLGGEATSAELAVDKKRARRIQHAATQCYRAWSSGSAFESLLTEELSREAAQVRWLIWMADHRTWLESRMRWVITWVIKNGQDERWAKSAVVRFNNELRWMEYALRD